MIAQLLLLRPLLRTQSHNDDNSEVTLTPTNMAFPPRRSKPSAPPPARNADGADQNTCTTLGASIPSRFFIYPGLLHSFHPSVMVTS